MGRHGRKKNLVTGAPRGGWGESGLSALEDGGVRAEFLPGSDRRDSLLIFSRSPGTRIRGLTGPPFSAGSSGGHTGSATLLANWRPMPTSSRVEVADHTPVWPAPAAQGLPALNSRRQNPARGPGRVRTAGKGLLRGAFARQAPTPAEEVRVFFWPFRHRRRPTLRAGAFWMRGPPAQLLGFWPRFGGAKGKTRKGGAGGRGAGGEATPPRGSFTSRRFILAAVPFFLGGFGLCASSFSSSGVSSSPARGGKPVAPGERG